MEIIKASSGYVQQEPLEMSVTLRKDISGIITDLMVKTVTDQVYQGDTTLTEIIDSLNADIKTGEEGLENLKERFDTLVKDMPEAYDTIKEIADWIEVHKVEYANVLDELDQRVRVEAGKGLSANDFTDEFKKKLNDLYTREETDTILTNIDNRISSLTSSDIAYTAEGEDSKVTTITEALHGLEKGAFRCVNTIEEMNSIIGTPQAEPGMFVYVLDGVGKTYQLNDDGTEFLWFNNGVITPEMLNQIMAHVEDNYEASILYNESGVDYLLLK